MTNTSMTSMQELRKNDKQLIGFPFQSLNLQLLPDLGFTTFGALVV